MNEDDELLTGYNADEDAMNTFIDSEKVLFKTYRKVEDQLKEAFPDKSDKELKKLFRSIMKQKYGNEESTKTSKHLFLPIFSSSPNCWFHDILENGLDSKPPHYYIFLGVNNHYAAAYAMKDRSTEETIRVLGLFVRKYHPLKLTSDKGRNVTSRETQNFLKSKHVQSAFVNAHYSNHVGLGTIDRFCRTIRDMNHRIIKIRAKQRVYPDDKRREPISEKDMKFIIKLYNNSYHFRIKMTPAEMLKNPQAEENYILVHLCDKEIVEEDGKLDEGTHVRVRIPKDKMKKRRSTVTEEVAEVVGKKGSQYVIQAEDGTEMTRTRRELVVQSTKGPSKYVKKISSFRQEGKAGRPKKPKRGRPKKS